MLRTGFRVAFRTFGSRSYSSAPVQEKAAVSSSFKIQDTNDFTERVKNSKVPVIVDFFAT